MKIAPVSADLLIKLTIGVIVVGGVVYVLKRAGSAVAGVMPDLDSINPASTENVIYQTANKVGGSLASDPAGPGMNADGSWTLGGWVYDILHGDQVGMMTTGKPKF